jgi:hypothetical protein
MNRDTPICKEFTEGESKKLLFVRERILEVWVLSENVMKIERNGELNQKVVAVDIVNVMNGTFIVVIDENCQWFVMDCRLETVRNGNIKKASSVKQNFVCTCSWNEGNCSLFVCSVLREHLSCFTIYWNKKKTGLKVKVENLKISNELHWNTVNSCVKAITVMKGNDSFDFAVGDM